MFVAYRVRRPFGWDGWQFKPGRSLDTHCVCAHRNYADVRPGECRCNDPRFTEENFAGDILIVSEGHPRTELLLSTRCVVYDATLDADELLQHENYQHLTQPLFGVGVQRRRLYNG